MNNLVKVNKIMQLVTRIIKEKIPYVTLQGENLAGELRIKFHHEYFKPIVTAHAIEKVENKGDRTKLRSNSKKVDEEQFQCILDIIESRLYSHTLMNGQLNFEIADGTMRNVGESCTYTLDDLEGNVNNVVRY